MIFLRRLLIISVCLFVGTTIASCSDVQNREKKTSTNSNKSGTISLTVSTRSTTTGTLTTDTFDTKIEAVVTKSLSKALIKGAQEKTLFSPAALVYAADAFPNNDKALKNTVDVSYSHMASANGNESVVVAEITQTITDSKKKKNMRTGKIFFDTTGIILGFEFPDAAIATTTTTGAQA